MTAEPKKSIRYSVFLAMPAVKNPIDFLTDTARANSVEVKSRTKLPFECQLFIKPPFLTVPGWAKKLDEHFEIDGKLTSAFSAAAIIFKCKNRIMACTYGHGHTMLDNDLKENDFGLLVAANSLSDENVKLVEKANLGSVIRDYTQAAGITRFQEFNADRALSLVRKLSGSSKANGATVSGSSAFSLSSHYDIDELSKLGEALLDLYISKSYQTSGFGIIDKIKPALNVSTIENLNEKLVENLQTDKPSFELGMPEIDTEPIGHISVGGANKRARYPDISLGSFLDITGKPSSVEDLYKYKVVTHNLEGHRLKSWTLYRGLVGSIDADGKRYALNEGRWYAIDDALITSANLSFQNASDGLDKTFLPWPIIGTGKKGKDPAFEPEKDFNARVHKNNPENFLLFDLKMFSIPNMPGPGVEICDLFDLENKKLIHVKKSGRRSSVISHFLAQGMVSAKLLRTYPQIKDAFFEELKKRISPDEYSHLESSFPHDWCVEFKFGDFPNKNGDYTIPFFSRVTLDEVKREIEALGFKSVCLSFIRLSTSKVL